MEKFTQLGLDRKPEVKPQISAAAKKPGSVKKTAAFVASSVAGPLLAIFLLQTSGCSKEANKAVLAPSNQTLLNPPLTTASSPSAPESTTTHAAVPPPTPKKIVKRRPSTLAYNDPASGVSFRYPRKYALTTPETSKPETARTQQFDMNFTQPGGVEVASVAMPQGTYPGTDLAGASFNVSVNKAMTPEQCGQFSLLQLASSDDLSVQPAKIRSGGQQLEEMEAISGPDGKQVDAKYYHLFENGACYEFALGLSTHADDSEDGVMPVDREAVFQRLEKILATVMIVPTASAVAEDATPASAPATTTAPAVANVQATPTSAAATANVPPSAATPATPNGAVQQ